MLLALEMILNFLCNLTNAFTSFLFSSQIVLQYELSQDLKRTGVAELPNSLPECAEYIFII